MIGLTSPTHLALLLLIALLLFGAKRVPEIGRSLGSGMREFKDSVSGNHTPEPQTHVEITAVSEDGTTTTTTPAPSRENETVH
jgi:sec-independent protein translocase protein TatA